MPILRDPLRVFLVEDEDMVAMLTEKMLLALGYKLAISVPSLERGIYEAANGDFDVAVLDINLRGFFSYPIADVLMGRGIPFVFATGYGSSHTEHRFSDIPVIQKPFLKAALGLVLCRALEQEACMLRAHARP